MNLLLFGFGFTGRALVRLAPHGWRIAGTSRDPARRAALADDGVDPRDAAALAQALDRSDALLVAAPPDADGCPGLRALGPAVAAGGGPRWIGYFSTTGVYGDRDGGWAFEHADPAPASIAAQRRVTAELGWREAAEAGGAALFTFRLPGIYGPGRSALDREREGQARQVVKPGHVFSRVHVDDIATGVLAALARRPRAGLYNLCDDRPTPAADVAVEAARLLGRPPPPETPFDPGALSPMARRFWAESRRVSNAKAKAALGWRPAYPTYREGLAAVLAAETMITPPAPKPT